jgi:hypothetical protein
MSNLPQALRRQVKAAAEMQTAVQNGTDPFAHEPAPLAPIQPQAAVTPPGAVPQAPAGPILDPGVPDGFKPVDLTRQTPANPTPRWAPASQTNQPSAIPAAAPAAAPPPGAQAVSNDADQRYRVLQGKYNTEVPTLSRQVRDLNGQVQELAATNRTLMAALQTRPVTPSAAPSVPKTTRDRALAAGFSEKEIEEFGEELVNMMLRTAENVAGPQLAQLRQENARLASTVNNTRQTIAQSAEQRFWADLETQVPEWAEINASQEWLDWLQLGDVFSGRTRNDGLQDAFRTYDARRVAGIMNTFKAEDARAPTVGNTHVDPTTLVAPGQPGSGTPAPAGMTHATEAPIWTEAQVRQFYSDKRRGKIRGAEAARVEAEINLATAQGRIKPDNNDAYLINSR